MATQAIPYQTANDLLAYQGNPALAAGANNGIVPQQGDPFAGLGNTIDQVNEHHARIALLNYQQKLKDQEDLANLLASTGGSVFNMKGANGQNVSYTPLPEDQKILDSKAKDLRTTILANPDNYWADPNYLDKLNEYKSLVNHAGIRSKAYTDFNLDAQKETDPQEQADILGQRNSEIKGYKLTDFHNPEPHLPSIPPGDPSDFVSKEAMEKKNWLLSGDDVSKETYLVPNQYITDPRTLVPGNPLYVKALKLGQKYLTSLAPQDLQDAKTAVPALNRATIEYNQGRGLTPGDPGYMEPIYSINPNTGQPQFTEGNSIKNALNIAAALTYENYGRPIEKKKSAEDIAKMQTQKEQQALREREESETERHNRAIEAKGDRPTAEALKQERDRQAALSTVKDVRGIMDDATKDKNKFKNIPGTNIPVPFNVPDALQKYRSEYELYKPITGEKADKYIGVEAPEVSTSVTDKNKTKTTVKSSDVSLKPDAVYPMVNKKTGQREFIFMADGKEYKVSEKEAAANGLKHDAQYVPAQYENKLPYIDEAFSGGAQTQQAPTVRNTIGNDAYEKVGGKWYKVE